MKKSREFSGLVFVSLCLIWGSTWLAIKVGLMFLPPFTFAGASFTSAIIGLLLLMLVLHKRIARDWSSWAVMIFLGLTMMGAGFAFQYWGEQYITSGLSAVLFATTPLFLVIFAHLLLEEEKITRWKAVGIMVSFAGLLAIFWRQLRPELGWNTQASLYGALAEVGSAAMTALAIVVYKRYYAQIDRLPNLFVQTIVGAVFLLSLGAVSERSDTFQVTPLALIAIIYLGFATTFPFIAYYWLLERSSVISISTITFITPILALALGWILLGEQIARTTIFGGALILAGVYLTFRGNERQKIHQ